MIIFTTMTSSSPSCLRLQLIVGARHEEDSNIGVDFSWEVSWEVAAQSCFFESSSFRNLLNHDSHCQELDYHDHYYKHICIIIMITSKDATLLLDQIPLPHHHYHCSDHFHHHITMISSSLWSPPKMLLSFFMIIFVHHQHHCYYHWHHHITITSSSYNDHLQICR